MERSRQNGGCEALQDRSSRPHRSPGRVHRTRERQVVRLRRKRWTQAAIADHLKMPLSTVGAVCRRNGVGRLRDLEPRPPVVRYERENAGELIHLDIKKLARIERIGHRIHGDRSRRSRARAGSTCTCASTTRAASLTPRSCPTRRGVTCAAFLERAAAWLRRCEVIVERVMTDNGSGYISKVFRPRSSGSELVTSEPGLTRHARTERPNASSRPASASGPTLDRIEAHAERTTALGASSATTTATAPTGASAGSRPSSASPRS